MKKFNLILIIVSTLLISQVASASYFVTEKAPVYPGDTTYVYVPIQNMGFGNTMEDVSVKLVPKENASVNAVTILNDVYSLGTITDWGDQRTAKFQIYVNPDAIEGDYYFYVYVTYKGLQTSSNTPITVTNKLEDQILTIRGKPIIILVNSTIDTVAPSSKNTETLTFKNTGTGTVQNAVAEINLANTNSVFSILGGGKQFSLGTLKAGDVSSIAFELAVDIAANPGVYNIPIKIIGHNYNSTDNIIGLVVAGIIIPTPVVTPVVTQTKTNTSAPNSQLEQEVKELRERLNKTEEKQSQQETRISWLESMVNSMLGWIKSVF